MACKKCGKAKCACGGMVKKANGGMVNMMAPPKPRGGSGYQSGYTPAGKPPMGGSKPRPMPRGGGSMSGGSMGGGSNMSARPMPRVAMKKGGMAKKRGK